LSRSGDATLHWSEQGQARCALWRSEGGQPLPRRVVCADDTMPADTAYRLACEGTALLWRGDFHNARQLLQAMARRLERKPRKAAKPAAAGAGPAQAFHLHRQAQGQRARVLAMLLIALEGDYTIALRRAPDWRAACTEAWGAAPGEPLVAPLRQLLGIVGAHEWRKKGVEIPALGSPPGNRIYPHYGVFSPVRGEYVDLVAQAPLPQVPGGCALAFDIGVGTGVLSAVLVRRGVARVVATDQDPRALACAQDNLQRLGVLPRVELRQADLFPPGQAPWWCATRRGCPRAPAARWSAPCTTKAAACCVATWTACARTWRRGARAGLSCRTSRNTWACAPAPNCWGGLKPPACACWRATTPARATARHRTPRTRCTPPAQPR